MLNNKINKLLNCHFNAVHLDTSLPTTTNKPALQFNNFAINDNARDVYRFDWYSLKRWTTDMYNTMGLVVLYIPKQEMSLKKDKRRQIKKGRKYNTRLSTCT